MQQQAYQVFYFMNNMYNVIKSPIMFFPIILLTRPETYITIRVGNEMGQIRVHS